MIKLRRKPGGDFYVGSVDENEALLTLTFNAEFAYFSDDLKRKIAEAMFRELPVIGGKNNPCAECPATTGECCLPCGHMAK